MSYPENSYNHLQHGFYFCPSPLEKRRFKIQVFFRALFMILSSTSSHKQREKRQEKSSPQTFRLTTDKTWRKKGRKNLKWTRSPSSATSRRNNLFTTEAQTETEEGFNDSDEMPQSPISIFRHPGRELGDR